LARLFHNFVSGLLFWATCILQNTDRSTGAADREYFSPPKNIWILGIQLVIDALKLT